MPKEAMNNFRSIGSHVRFFSNPGSRIANEYRVKIDQNGHKVVEVSGKKDIYAPMQEFLEETKITNIIARCLQGDTSSLREPGSYGDFTNMPISLADAQNKILEIEQEFERLPIDIKRQFDHSAEKYIKEIGSEKWLKLMGYNTEEKKTEPEATTPVESEG
ncbi:MAG: hypothetical protein HUJ63_02470 [Enterococcus sp.]|nr:hypothetical protein [Enterococcus sp.]